MKRYDDVQLSRILSAHAAGELISGGQNWYVDWCDHEWRSCLVQAAELVPFPGRCHGRNQLAVEWFDRNYNRNWTVDQFLRQLERVGIA